MFAEVKRFSDITRMRRPLVLPTARQSIVFCRAASNKNRRRAKRPGTESPSAVLELGRALGLNCYCHMHSMPSRHFRSEEAHTQTTTRLMKRAGLFEVQVVTPPKESLGVHSFHPDTHNGDQIHVQGKVDYLSSADKRSQCKSTTRVPDLCWQKRRGVLCHRIGWLAVWCSSISWCEASTRGSTIGLMCRRCQGNNPCLPPNLLLLSQKLTRGEVMPNDDCRTVEDLMQVLFEHAFGHSAGNPKQVEVDGGRHNALRVRDRNRCQ